MTTWHQRMLPYPLLAPWTDDYENCSFSADVPEAVLNNGSQIKLDLAFRLHSSTLRRLITDDQARFAVQVSCPRTSALSTHPTSERDTLVLDAGDYSEEVQITPYVVSNTVLDDFKSTEHAAEWRQHRPQGFTVPTAGILAVGNNTRIVLQDSGVDSVIDLVSDPNVSDGSFDVQLDDERIKIHVPLAEKEKIEAVRTRRGSNAEYAALFPGLYLHAVTEALRHLAEHDGTRWAFAIRNALDASGRSTVDSELLRLHALSYAQELMRQPVGLFLTAAMSSEREEE